MFGECGGNNGHSKSILHPAYKIDNAFITNTIFNQRYMIFVFIVCSFRQVQSGKTYGQDVVHVTRRVAKTGRKHASSQAESDALSAEVYFISFLPTIPVLSAHILGLHDKLTGKGEVDLIKYANGGPQGDQMPLWVWDAHMRMFTAPWHGGVFGGKFKPGYIPVVAAQSGESFHQVEQKNMNVSS